MVSAPTPLPQCNVNSLEQLRVTMCTSFSGYQNCLRGEEGGGKGYKCAGSETILLYLIMCARFGKVPQEISVWIVVWSLKIAIYLQVVIYDRPVVLCRSQVVLCFSPVGSTLRVRSRKFPAVTNCTAIDWFHEWPQEALVSVSKRFIDDLEQLEVSETVFLDKWQSLKR